MFSGIVEEAAPLTAVTRHANGNVDLRVKPSVVSDLKIDQSIAHNGVCLTVVALHEDGTYTVTAIQETLSRSNLGALSEGSLVNLERSMLMNGRLDGHIVQGHVDTTAECVDIEDLDGSRYFKFRYDVSDDMARQGYMTVEKGSVTVNGVSLTVCDSERDSFRVAIIPYTLEHTNFKEIKVGTRVNIEFDILGKYLAKLASL
ncbi:MAG: riboflavin synthase [Duncaniella sp.]|nr:riboflavin synthase [Duncaniella sp.]